MNGEATTGRAAMLAKLAALDAEHAKAVAGGGPTYVDRHHARGRLLARERIELLLDEGSAFLELSPLAGWGSDFTVGASVVTGIGVVSGVECMVIANDPTVRGGASNPWTVKKLFRAAQIAKENRLPTVNLVESGGADGVVAAPGGQRGQFQERGVGVQQQLDALAGQQLAAPPVPLDVLLAAARERLGVLGLQFGELGEHGLAVGLVVGAGGVESGPQNRHSRISGMSRWRERSHSPSALACGSKRCWAATPSPRMPSTTKFRARRWGRT